MEQKPENSNNKYEEIRELKIILNSKEEAIELVKEFWHRMPDGEEVIKLVEKSVDKDWGQQLTYGDRTQIMEGRLRDEKGKWVVLFTGNHEPLSYEALIWLRSKKLF
jgi:hypothetical protein